jgi:bacterioferritin
MKHADELIDCILILEGLPNIQNLGKLSIGKGLPEMLQCDLDRELDAIPNLTAVIAYCEVHKDCVSRDLFARIPTSEEEHVDWLEFQLNLINKSCEQNNLQSQTHQSARRMFRRAPHAGEVELVTEMISQQPRGHPNPM